MPPVGSSSLQNGAADGGLAAAGFAHQAERLAGRNLEGNILDGFAPSRSSMTAGRPP